MTLVFKRPDAFVEKHGDMLRAVDWTITPRLSLSEALPDEPDLAGATIEAIARGPDTVVRSADGPSMVAVRNYAIRISHERAAAASHALDQLAEAAIAELNSPSTPPETTEQKAMPAEVKGLSEALRQAKETIARAPQVVDGLNRNVSDLSDALSQVEGFSAEVRTHTNEVRGLLGGMTNGPPGEDEAEAKK